MQLDHTNTLNLTIADVVAKRIAVLGASGSGKTNTVARLVEELLPSMPVTIIDPHEDYWGLREAFPILIAGKGKHVDMPLTLESAPALAAYSFRERLPVILDLLLMTEDERHALVVAYCEALWQAAISADVRLPYTVVLDEAHIFIPEGGRDTASTKRMKQFASEGRKFGIGMILSTQRAAAISKAVLANCEMLFLHGVQIENDAKAYQSVLPCDLAETKRIAYALDTGECLFRQGRRMEQVRILKRATFHAGDTPTLESAAPPMLKQIDAALLDSLKAALELPAGEALAGHHDAPADTATLDALASERAENERLRAKNLRLELDLQAAQGDLKRAQDQAERLQARLNKQREKPVLEPVQETLIARAAEGERRIERTTTTTEVVTEYRSTRSVAIRVNRQTKKFNDKLSELRKLSALESAILLTLIESPEVWTAELLARAHDCTVKWAATIANRFVGTGLIIRPNNEIRTYKGNARWHLREEYPDLVLEELFKRIVVVLGN